MASAPLNTIVICGGGVAGYICACALDRTLPKDIKLILIETDAAKATDILFGTLTSPTTYDFLLDKAFTEPDLFLNTQTDVSLGTKFENWGPARRNWMQSFYKPLPVLNGVEFQHYLTRFHQTAPDKASLEDYIISTQAAKAGGFAHPPEARKTPLADMDYGYKYSPKDWRAYFSGRLSSKRVTRLQSDVTKVERSGETVTGLTLDNAQTVKADFFIDASGPNSKLKSPSDASWVGTREICAVETHNIETGKRHPYRTVRAADYGWQSETTLQNQVHRLTVYDPNSERAALKAHGTPDHTPVKVQLGRTETPWIGNCLTFGHGAASLEPLTSAPMRLIERDIDRLIELIPVSKRMTVERREYNRRFNDDYSHADLFLRAFFANEKTGSHPYWATASSVPITKRLQDKVEQFESRGVLVQYDYEPFSREDWALLHIGMGRVPRRYDPLADRVSLPGLTQKLEQMRHAIDVMAKKLPPHDVYMSRLIKYLEDQNV